MKSPQTCSRHVIVDKVFVTSCHVFYAPTQWATEERRHSAEAGLALADENEELREQIEKLERQKKEAEWQRDELQRQLHERKGSGLGACCILRRQKGGFVLGVHANVPSFLLSFQGNIRMYPGSGFRSGEPSAKPPFQKPPSCQPQIVGIPQEQYSHVEMIGAFQEFKF